MFGFKVVVLVMAAVCTAQGQHTRVKRSIWFNPLAAVTTTPEQAMASALESIKSHSGKLNDTVKSATEKLKKYIDRAHDLRDEGQIDAQEQVDQIIRNARLKAQNEPGLLSCYEQKVTDLETMSYQKTIDIVSCLTASVSKLEDMLETIIQVGKTCLALLPSIVVQCLECHVDGGIIEVYCHLRIAGNFIAKCNFMIANIISVCAKAASSVLKRDSFIIQCLAVPITQMTFWATVHFGKLAVCSLASIIG